MFARFRFPIGLASPVVGVPCPFYPFGGALWFARFPRRLFCYSFRCRQRVSHLGGPSSTKGVRFFVSHGYQVRVYSRSLGVPSHKFRGLRVVTGDFGVSLSVLQPIRGDHVGVVTLAYGASVLEDGILVVNVHRVSLQGRHQSLSRYLPMSNSMCHLSICLRPFSRFSRSVYVLFQGYSVQFQSSVGGGYAVFTSCVSRVRRCVKELLVVVSGNVSPKILDCEHVVLPRVQHSVIWLASFRVVSYTTVGVYIGFNVGDYFFSPLYEAIMVVYYGFAGVQFPYVLLSPPIGVRSK